jgi:RNA-binding protein
MELSGKQRRALRARARALRPIVHIGQAGMSPAVVAETAQALSDHELIKVRLASTAEKAQAASALAEATGAAVCGIVGRVAILYRPDPAEPRIVLPA